MDKLKKYNLIIGGISLLNIVLMMIISIGFLQNNIIAKIYFFLSYTIIPALIGVSSIACQYYLIQKEGKDLIDCNTKWYTLIPFINFMIIILVFTAKFAIQLDKEVLTEVITLGITFVLSQTMMLLLYKSKEYAYKRSLKLYLTSLGLYLFYIALIMVLTFDYSTII